jgi:hypothetical protein
MPRGGGGRSGFGSRSSSSSSSSSRSSSASQAPPRAAPQAPPQAAPMQGPGLMGTMAQGMAFGAGSAVAHEAIRGVMGSNSHQARGNAQNNFVQEVPCQFQNNNFIECLKFNSNDIARCQSHFDAIQQCRQGTGF